MNWLALLYVLGAGLLVWFMFRTVRANPALFSKDNLNKSLFSMGILALILIAFIALLVMLLKK